MTGSIVISFFIIWFAINVTYVFNRKALGKFGKWLHRWGWINEWSMFTGQKSSSDKFQLLYSDFNSKDETLIWKSVNLGLIQSLKVIVNPNFKFEFFLAKCIKKINAPQRVNANATCNLEAFDYLCSVIIQLPNTDNNKFRRIKIERHTADNQVADHISSNDFELL